MRKYFLLGLALLATLSFYEMRANHDIIVDLDGGIYNFNYDGKLVAPYSGDTALVLKNGTFRNLSGTTNAEGEIIFMDANSTVSIMNATIALDGDYTFTQGNIYIRNTVYLTDLGSTNSHQFGIMDDATIYIEPYSQLILDGGINVTFSDNTAGIVLMDINSSKMTVEDDANADLSNINSLTLNQGTELAIQGDETLDAGDGIYVFGLNNKLFISGSLTVNGDIILDDQSPSELTIVFPDDAIDPVVYINSNLVIPEGGRLAFSGNGCVIFKNGTLLTLNGYIVFEDYACWSLEGSSSYRRSKMTVNGDSGHILLKTGGRISIDSKRQLIIGGTTPTTCDIDVIRNAQFKAINGGRISISKVTGALNFQQEGAMVIGDEESIIEINSLNDIHQTDGNITSWTFGTDAKLDVRRGAKLLLGENLSSVSGSTPTSLKWDSSGGDVTGVGVIRYVHQSEFNGQPFGVNRLFEKADITIEELMRRLVNRVDALGDSAVMTDRDGEIWLRIKNSAWTNSQGTQPFGWSNVGNVHVVKLRDNDVVESEGDFGVDGRNTRSKRTFSYDINGVRRNS